MTTLSLTFTEPARVTLTSDGGLSLGFPSPQAVTLSAVGLQGPPGVGGGGGVTDGDKGDITVSGSGAAWTIDAGAVTLSKMADLASSTILGRATAGTGVPEALTAAQVRTILNVANGATANQADAFLLSRANHTGTQTASTISDFAEAVDDEVASLLVAGANVTLTYNDAANTLTVAASGGGGSPVTVQDEGSNITTALSTLNFVGAGVTVTGGATATVTIPGGGGGSVLSGSATLTLSTGRYEHQETVTATGVTGTNRISVWLDPATDDDENVPEMTDLITMAAAPGTNQITVTAAFHIPHSGPLKIQWSAF
jgi:hypothetical protein